MHPMRPVCVTYDVLLLSQMLKPTSNGSRIGGLSTTGQTTSAPIVNLMSPQSPVSNSSFGASMRHNHTVQSSNCPMAPNGSHFFCECAGSDLSSLQPVAPFERCPHCGTPANPEQLFDAVLRLKNVIRRDGLDSVGCYVALARIPPWERRAGLLPSAVIAIVHVLGNNGQLHWVSDGMEQYVPPSATWSYAKLA